MAVKIFIRRTVPRDKAKEMIPLFRQMRASATTQSGYISGETMRSMDNPEDFMVISTWQTREDWEQWLKSEDRHKVQSKIDDLLGGTTHYELFHYGFTE